MLHKAITISIPTRGRLDLVSEVIDAAITNATFKGDIEVVLRVDIDDQTMLNIHDQLPWKNHVRIISGPRKKGYQSIHDFHYEVIKSSNSEWFFLLGDDCKITSVGWDEQILAYNTPKVIKHASMWPPDLYDRLFCPIVHTQIVNTLGHVAKHFLFDGYVFEYARGANLFADTNIEIHHAVPEAHATQAREDINKSLEQWRANASPQENQLKLDNIAKDISILKKSLDI